MGQFEDQLTIDEVLELRRTAPRRGPGRPRTRVPATPYASKFLELNEWAEQQAHENAKTDAERDQAAIQASMEAALRGGERQRWQSEALRLKPKTPRKHVSVAKVLDVLRKSQPRRWGRSSKRRGE
jgi:hypothetical protein